MRIYLFFFSLIYQLKKLSKSNFIDFQNKHFYTRTSKTFEYRRSILDDYLKVNFDKSNYENKINKLFYFQKLIDFYAGNYPKELLNFIQYTELKKLD